jgi:hypothetical protein
MDLSVSWRNPKHFLLKNPTVTLEVDGVAVLPATMREGIAEFVVPQGSASPPMATVTVSFSPTVGGTTTETLRIVQRFVLSPPTGFGGGGPQPTSYVVKPDGFAAPVEQAGKHPLLHQGSSLNFWWIVINTRTVDVTNIPITDETGGKRALKSTLRALIRPNPDTNVRVLARTDGKLPFHWVTATPRTCATFTDTDLLCFLTPPQTIKQPDRDDSSLFTSPKAGNQLEIYVATWFAKGKHDPANTLDPLWRDHFARAHDPSDPRWPDQPSPIVWFARSWESALATSGKHVAMVLPFPSAFTHDQGAMAKLPALLSDIFAALVAIGDIAAPAGVQINRQPRLGIAAFSNGGGSLFAAVRRSPAAFQEIWLFETIDNDIPVLGTAAAAQVLFAGFNPGSVKGPHEVALRLTTRTGAVRRLPQPELSYANSPAALAASSSILTHALVGSGMVVPPETWKPRIYDLGKGEKFVEFTKVLHQQIVQGNDADGQHYLTKALVSSTFH